MVLAIGKESFEVVKEIHRPKFLPSQGTGISTLENSNPCMNWGYGHSPAFKDKCYATLVVGWGPLVQLHVLYNVEDDNG